MAGLLQVGSLFGLEGLNVGGGVGLLQILPGCCSTIRIQIKSVAMDVSVSLYVWSFPLADTVLSVNLTTPIFTDGVDAINVGEACCTPDRH